MILCFCTMGYERLLVCVLQAELAEEEANQQAGAREGRKVCFCHGMLKSVTLYS